MRIMVFDVAADGGGALSVLNDFYNEYKSDIQNEYIFVISTPELMETENIKVLNFPWIRKSWFHRLYFDHFIAPGLICSYMIDEVLSLQNIMIPHTKIKQTVYYHNSLPLIDYRFSIFEDRLLWTYQNVISRLIFKSIKKADKVIVQTQWMKKACVEKLKVSEEKFTVMPPKINVDVRKPFVLSKDSLSTFFYPASANKFKNHRIIIEACRELKKMGVEDYKVILTLRGDESKIIADLYQTVQTDKLPIKFIGVITRDEVFQYYSDSTLLFPSYIESSPLPLTEAKMHDAPIIVSDCSFSHEILDNYDKTVFFDPFDKSELADKLCNSIEKAKGCK